MDRRYHGLKALVVGVAVAAAVVGGGFECSQLTVSRNASYQAAFVVQSNIRDASAAVSHSVRAVLWRIYSSL